MLREAKLTLKRLNDARVLGRGYDPADVLALRNCCQEGGVSVDVGTDTTRDALYRRATDAEITDFSWRDCVWIQLVENSSSSSHMLGGSRSTLCHLRAPAQGGGGCRD